MRLLCLLATAGSFLCLAAAAPNAAGQKKPSHGFSIMCPQTGDNCPTDLIAYGLADLNNVTGYIIYPTDPPLAVPGKTTRKANQTPDVTWKIEFSGLSEVDGALLRAEEVNGQQSDEQRINIREGAAKCIDPGFRKLAKAHEKLSTPARHICITNIPNGHVHVQIRPLEVKGKTTAHNEWVYGVLINTQGNARAIVSFARATGNDFQLFFRGTYDPGRYLLRVRSFRHFDRDHVDEKRIELEVD